MVGWVGSGPLFVRSRFVKRSRSSVSMGRPYRVGCAGWSLNSRVAPLFTAEGSHLQRYARVFPSVEINSSFYRSHQPKTYARWAASVPDTFRFSVKMPRTVTHDMRLQNCEDAVHGFLDEVAHLGDKLGCILVQLPPSLVFDAEITNGFFAALRSRASAPIACEPRHASWFTDAAADVLRRAEITRVQADPAPVERSGGTSLEHGILYIRLHGSPRIYYSAYDDDFIADIAAQMRSANELGREAWCIFDNTAMGAAMPNALTLLNRLT